MDGGHPEAGAWRLGQFRQRIGAERAQTACVGAGVGLVGLGVGGVDLTQFTCDRIDLGDGPGHREKRVRVDHTARAAPASHARGRQQRHIGIGLDQRQVGFFAGSDHAFGKVVVTNAVDHHHVQRTDALDVLSPGLVGMRIEACGNHRHHLGAVAHDVGHIAVVRMQGHTDAQAPGAFTRLCACWQHQHQACAQQHVTSAQHLRWAGGLGRLEHGSSRNGWHPSGRRLDQCE